MTNPVDLAVLDTPKSESQFRSQILSPLAAVQGEQPGGAVISQLTLASGTIVPTAAAHTVDTQGEAPSGTLQTIALTNHPQGRWLLLQAADAGRTVIVKHGHGGNGQILTADGADFPLAGTARAILLVRRGTSWREVSRSYGGPAAWREAARVPWLGVTPRSSSWSVAAGDAGRLFTVDASGGAVTATLPAAAAVGAGEIFSFKRVDASGNAVTVGRAGSDTVDGGTSITVPRQWDAVTVISDGVSAWSVLRHQVAAAVTLSTAGLATGGGTLDQDRAITVPKAGAGDIRGWADDSKAMTSKGTADAAAEVDDGNKSGSFSLNIAGGNNRRIRLTGNATLSNLTGVTPNEVVTIWVEQDGTGGRTLSFGSNFRAMGDLPELASAANSVSLLQIKVRSSSYFALVGGGLA